MPNIKNTKAVYYFGHKKRPFASSTLAVKKTLALFKPLTNSWFELKNMLPYGVEEKKIIDIYIRENIKFENVLF